MKLPLEIEPISKLLKIVKASSLRSAKGSVSAVTLQVAASNYPLQLFAMPSLPFFELLLKLPQIKNSFQKKLKRPLAGKRSIFILPTAKRTPPRVRNKPRRTSINRGRLSAERKSMGEDLFLVLVPQGLELLLALVFGDLLAPFLLQVAHDSPLLFILHIDKCRSII